MTFLLPLMFFGCLNYEMHSGETLSDWKILQPMVITVSGPDVHDVTIRNMNFADMAQVDSCATHELKEPK